MKKVIKQGMPTSFHMQGRVFNYYIYRKYLPSAFHHAFNSTSQNSKQECHHGILEYLAIP